jgi:hypothetical protein
MKLNLSGLERFIRLFLGVLIIMAFATGTSGALMWVGILLGVGILLTGAVGYCQVYSLMGIDTRNSSEKSSES